MLCAYGCVLLVKSYLKRSSGEHLSHLPQSCSNIYGGTLRTCHRVQVISWLRRQRPLSGSPGHPALRIESGCLQVRVRAERASGNYGQERDWRWCKSLVKTEVLDKGLGFGFGIVQPLPFTVFDALYCTVPPSADRGQVKEKRALRFVHES